MLAKLSRFPFLFVIFALLLCSCESRKTIVNQLDERDANEIVVLLSKRGIDAIKVVSPEASGGGGAKTIHWDISVSQDQANQAMYILNQNGLPRKRGQNLLNIFQDTGLVPSESMQKIRYQAGLAEQIATTIRKIDGILDAEVQISFPEEDPLNPGGPSKKKITSSVYIKHNGVLDDPNSHLITKIKRLVSASVTGLDFDNVTVIGDKARYSEFSSGDEASFSEDEKQFVSIWGVVVSKESASRFRILFFSLSIAILILLLLIIWSLWKIYPVMGEHGGMRKLFQLKPIVEPKKPKKEGEEGEEEEAIVDEKKKDEPEDNVT